jgi:hypothetical protein
MEYEIDTLRVKVGMNRNGPPYWIQVIGDGQPKNYYENGLIAVGVEYCGRARRIEIEQPDSIRDRVPPKVLHNLKAAFENGEVRLIGRR